MYLPCMLQNKVCLEHVLSMAPSSIQAPLYANVKAPYEFHVGFLLPIHACFASLCTHSDETRLHP
jgi:hypothetical protein